MSKQTNISPEIQTSESVQIQDNVISGESQRSVQLSKRLYHTRLNPPKVEAQKFTQPSKVQENPFDARDPQELLAQHGMYRDDSIYKQNPAKIYLDLTKFDDYQTSLNKKIQAEDYFNHLNVDIRAKFNHDPLKFAEYLGSDGFDMNEILTPDEKVSLKRYLDKQESERKYQEYLNSPEYQQSVKDFEEYSNYQKQQYENWKKNRS